MIKLTRDLILGLIIIGYLLSVFSFLVYENSITFENNKKRPISMIKLDMIDNVTVTTPYEIENPYANKDASEMITLIMQGTAGKMAFVLPFAIAGLGMIGAPIGLITTSFVIPPEGYRVMAFWLVAMSTIPINYLFTKNIPLYRRVPVIYLLAAIISGTPMMLNSNFGG